MSSQTTIRNIVGLAHLQNVKINDSNVAEHSDDFNEKTENQSRTTDSSDCLGKKKEAGIGRG